MTELHQLVNQHADSKLIKKLLQKGTDPDVKTPSRQVTPLHLAANVDNVDAAKLLLSFGANIHARTRDGKTPYDIAMRSQSFRMIRLLRDIIPKQYLDYLES